MSQRSMIKQDQQQQYEDLYEEDQKYMFIGLFFSGLVNHLVNFVSFLVSSVRHLVSWILKNFVRW